MQLLLGSFQRPAAFNELLPALINLLAACGNGLACGEQLLHFGGCRQLRAALRELLEPLGHRFRAFGDLAAARHRGL
ncbi:hypothetical protein D1872_327910 [compost metagenome]